VSGSRRATAETLRTGLIGAALIAVGAAAWTLALRPSLEVDTRPLASLPEQLGAWTGKDVALQDDVVSMLRADFNVQRLYQRDPGDYVWLYIGYYGTDRGGHPEHTPDACYVAQGWRSRRASSSSSSSGTSRSGAPGCSAASTRPSTG
jgi:hypothetical protein